MASAQRGLASIVERTTLAHGGRFALAFQGGFSLFPEDGNSLDQVFRNLLNLLHSRKAEGRGQFVGFNPAMYREFLRQETIRAELGKAIRAGTPYLVFQPRVEAGDGRVTGFEALARWEDPALGPISPAEFIPLSERYDLIAPLTLLLLDKAYGFIRELGSRGFDSLRVSVNLSPGILNPGFLERLALDIGDNGLGPSLELEITEGILMELDEPTRMQFERLKRLGVGFSIDDFGTGYSNLGYLQDFEAEILKIDKRFIDGVPANGKNGKLVLAILRMAKSFDMTVVVEGVEYREQRDFLAGHGCDQIQGFYYSRPLSAAAALAYATGAAKR